MKKKIILPIALAAVLGLGVVGISQVNAQTNGSFLNGLAAVIAQKFHLDQSEVQGVIDQFHGQQVQNRQQKYQDSLDQAVTQGKITASQKQEILDERTKLQGEFNPTSLKNMTTAQRQEAFTNERTEISNWSKSTGISASWLKTGFGWGMGRHFGGMMDKDDTSNP